jgi:predicted RNA-binding protein
MKVIMDYGSRSEKIMEDVVGLDVTGDGIIVTALFNETQVAGRTRITTDHRTQGRHIYDY